MLNRVNVISCKWRLILASIWANYRQRTWQHIEKQGAMKMAKCSMVKCLIVKCSTVNCSMEKCLMVKCSMVKCLIVKCSIAKCSMVKYSMVKYSMVKCSHKWQTFPVPNFPFWHNLKCKHFCFCFYNCCLIDHVFFFMSAITMIINILGELPMVMYRPAANQRNDDDVGTKERSWKLGIGGLVQCESKGTKAPPVIYSLCATHNQKGPKANCNRNQTKK